MFIVVMFVRPDVLSVNTTNIQPDTKKLEQGPRPTHSLSPQTFTKSDKKNNICFSKVNFLLVGAVMNIGRENKFLLIETARRDSRAHRSNLYKLYFNTITLQSFQWRKINSQPFSLNTIQLTRQTLFMSSLQGLGASS